MAFSRTQTPSSFRDARMRLPFLAGAFFSCRWGGRVRGRSLPGTLLRRFAHPVHAPVSRHRRPGRDRGLGSAPFPRIAGLHGRVRTGGFRRSVPGNFAQPARRSFHPWRFRRRGLWRRAGHQPGTGRALLSTCGPGRCRRGALRRPHARHRRRHAQTGNPRSGRSSCFGFSGRSPRAGQGAG